MIFESLSCLAEELNEFFRIKLKIQEEKVILSGIINQDGTVAIQGENKLVITLVNIMKDVTGKNATPLTVRPAVNNATPLSIHLCIMISAHFSSNNYPEALRFISFVIAFLQEKNVFSHSNTPRLDDNIEKLVFEMETYDADKLNNIWATLGAKYMPSVFYRIRMLTYDSLIIKEYRPLVTGISGNNA
jgi:hypothetical protein